MLFFGPADLLDNGKAKACSDNCGNNQDNRAFQPACIAISINGDKQGLFQKATQNKSNQKRRPGPVEPGHQQAEHPEHQHDDDVSETITDKTADINKH